MPVESRLTLGSSRRNNRRRAAPVRERLPELRRLPRRLWDACGRAVRRAVPALALAGIAGALGGAGYAGYHFLTTSPRFAIDTIVVSGTHTLTPDEIRARVPLALGDNVFRADVDAIEAALEREPWIADATVRRRLPRAIAIEVRERQAAALVEIGGLYLADADGRVFKRAATREGVDLPVITGITRDDVRDQPDDAAARIRRALGAITAWRAADRPAIGEVRVDRRLGVTLFTYDEAVAVRLGEADGPVLAARLDRFDAAWAALSPDERRRARALHLDHDTRPDHVTVAFAH